MIVWPSTIENSNTKNLKFESAEGCYSQAVIRRNDVRVKWAVKAFTDVGEGGPVYAQGVHLSLGSPPSLTSSRAYAPKSVLYTAATATPEDGERLLELSSNWFEDGKKHPKYSEAGLPIQKLVGERSRVETYHTLYKKNGDETLTDVKCMYWAPKTYQMDICTVDGDVGADEVVILEKGVLYKQKYGERRGLFPEGVRSFPFFHFQVRVPSLPFFIFPTAYVDERPRNRTVCRAAHIGVQAPRETSVARNCRAGACGSSRQRAPRHFKGCVESC